MTKCPWMDKCEPFQVLPIGRKDCEEQHLLQTVNSQIGQTNQSRVFPNGDDGAVYIGRQLQTPV